MATRTRTSSGTRGGGFVLAACVLAVLVGVVLSLLGALAAGGYLVWLMARNASRALGRGQSELLSANSLTAARAPAQPSTE